MVTKFKLILFTVVMVIVAATCYEMEQREQAKLKTLSFNNIEALAGNEGGTEIRCMEYGSVDCVGYKVKYKYEFSARIPMMK